MRLTTAEHRLVGMKPALTGLQSLGLNWFKVAPLVELVSS